MENLKKSFWRDAARGGAVLGLIVAAVLMIGSWTMVRGIDIGRTLTFVEFVLVVVAIFVLARRRGVRYGAAGYTYAQSIAFIIAMLLFSGFIYGVSMYAAVNYVAHDHYIAAIEGSRDAMAAMVGADDVERGMEIAHRMMRNPLFFIFYGFVAMLIYGGAIGLFASAFARRLPVMPPRTADTQLDDNE